MNREQLRAKFPESVRHSKAVEKFLDAHCPDDNGSGLRSLHPKPNGFVPLDHQGQGEEACWHDAAPCFQIVFTVYSRHPCDYDGYDIKALQDFLVKAGVLPDDGWKTISGRVLSKKVSTEGEEKTVVTVTTCQSLE